MSPFFWISSLWLRNLLLQVSKIIVSKNDIFIQFIRDFPCKFRYDVVEITKISMFCKFQICGSVRFLASKMGSLPANRCKSRDSCGISSGPNTKIYNPYGINALNKFYIFLKNTYRSRSLHFRPLNPWFQEFQFL